LADGYIRCADRFDAMTAEVVCRERHRGSEVWTHSNAGPDAEKAQGGGILRQLGSCGEMNMFELNRITQDPGVMGGKPCIRGLRVTVGMIVGQIGAGHTIEEILADYPYLEREDILQALRYAAWRAEQREVNLPTA